MNTPTTAREFIPDINTANEEIARLDAQLAALKSPRTEQPPKQAPKQAAAAAAPLTGVQRAMAANVRQQAKR